MQIIQTETFSKWFLKLRDNNAKERIVVRLTRVASGHLGDVKSVGDGVFELRIDYGQGYRLYFKRKGSEIIALRW